MIESNVNAVSPAQMSHSTTFKQLLQFHFDFNYIHNLLMWLVVLDMTLNCQHRVIFLPHLGANDLSCWSAVKHQLSLSISLSADVSNEWFLILQDSNAAGPL